MTAAFLCAFLVVNFVCCFYCNMPQTIPNLDRYTVNKHKTRQYNFYGLEGFGITSTDKHGFFNDSTVIPQEAKTICIGSSQTRAVGVDTSENYVSRLNILNSAYKAYNIGNDGKFMRDNLYRLPYIPKSFASCKLIILETPFLPTLTDWDEIILFLEANNTPIIKQNWKDRNIVFQIYRSLPFPYLHFSINQIKTLLKNRTDTVDNPVDLVQFGDKANRVMKLLKNRLGDMPVIIMYLPRVHLEKSGHITISNDDECQKILKEACEANHILYVYDQLSATFIENYETHRILPYGFLNSHIGQGHLNAEGHRMIAETLHKILQEEGLGQ
ncbi:MAG: hypothetical protein IJ812_00280 [Schwartzia sp.]|nr:hypothetical protein [Schwartzia sp. (in: firmicutes)]